MEMTPPPQSGMPQIEAQAKLYADARLDLNARVQTLQAAIAAAQRECLPGIREAIGIVADRHTALNNLIANSPELFEKPRTVSFYGIKVGLQKGAGSISWEDAKEVVKKIEKLFRGDQDMLDTLIITKKKPNKAAMLTLDVSSLKILGCQVLETGDQVVIKAADTGIDKLVRALLKGAVEEADEHEESDDA